jgi:hypothetical protein
MTLAATAKESLRFAKSNIGLLFLLQLPMGLLVLLQRVMEPFLEGNPLVGLIILLPLFSVGSNLCTALTFCVLQLPAPRHLTDINQAWQKLAPQFGPLVLSSAIIALFFGLGLAAFVLPGLYFISLYFFVPLFVITEPGQPIAKYFYQSKKLVTQSRKTLLGTLGFVTITFLIEIPISILVDALSRPVGGAAFFDVILTMLFGVIIDCFIIFYFLSIKPKGNS